jgi:hypothetical protein
MSCGIHDGAFLYCIPFPVRTERVPSAKVLKVLTPIVTFLLDDAGYLRVGTPDVAWPLFTSSLHKLRMTGFVST